MGRMGASGKSDRKIIDMIYPVGSVYISVSNVSPATLFGGSWEQLKDRFLLGAGDTYTAGATGGEATHALTQNEMPSHTHTGKTRRIGKVATASGLNEASNVSKINVQGAEQGTGSPGWQWASYQWTDTPNSTGGGAAHNNMPPYLVVYMWKRTA